MDSDRCQNTTGNLTNTSTKDLSTIRAVRDYCVAKIFSYPFVALKNSLSLQAKFRVIADRIRVVCYVMR
jgi:hypothetical protein